MEATIAEVARGQHGVIARWQLLALGLGEDAVEHRLGVGRLHRLHEGVYAVGHRAVPEQGWWLAAVLVSGPGALLSHHTAAALWGLRGYSGGAIHVTIPRKSTSSKRIRRHHAVVPEDERSVEEEIPVTSVHRSILDLAATEPVDVVKAMIKEAEYRRHYDRLSLPALLERHPGRRGVRKVRLALKALEADPPGRPRGPLEERFLPFLRRFHLPSPRLNDWILLGDKRFQADCHWPTASLIVELDSWEAHGTRSSFRSDKARDRAFAVAGYRAVRLSWAQLEDEPHEIAADLRALLVPAPDARAVAKDEAA